MAFSHQKLEVYKEALLFIEWVETSLRPALRGRAHLIDQIARASSSIALNIAEGCGRWSAGDKIRFYSFAMGSAAECSATLDVIAHSGAYDPNNLDFIEAVQRINRIGAWITNLSRSAEERGKR